MIKTPEKKASHDRLTAFLKTFALRADRWPMEGEMGAASLFVLGDTSGEVSHVVFRSRGGAASLHAKVLASAGIDFGSDANPLTGALPEELLIPLADSAPMKALATLLVAEHEITRCGGSTVRDRLCEVIVVLAIRRAIAIGTVNAGLLAGLAHPQLYLCLIAMHDAPARDWRVERLAQIAGMSRSGFSTLFLHVVGKPPSAYLTGWRLALGQYRLRAGKSVKAVAAEVGFGSQAAFSRAFSREYGYPPSAVECAADQ